jgi:hypothetical protein
MMQKQNKKQLTLGGAIAIIAVCVLVLAWLFRSSYVPQTIGPHPVTVHVYSAPTKH